MLLVRAGSYEDERKQRVIRVVHEVWKHVQIPEDTVIVTKELTKKWYRACRELYAGHFFRYWGAWEAYKTLPAEWLAIADIDVLPLRKDAVKMLLEFLSSLPEHVGIVTRICIGVAGFIDDNFFFPSEGLLAVRKPFIPSLLSLILNYHMMNATQSSNELKKYVLACEGRILSHLPFRGITFFPEHLLLIGGVDKCSIEWDTAFLHVAGDNSHPNYFNCVLSLLRKFTLEG